MVVEAETTGSIDGMVVSMVMMMMEAVVGPVVADMTVTVVVLVY